MEGWQNGNAHASKACGENSPWGFKSSTLRKIVPFKEIFTIGHSTRKLEEFLEILKKFKIEVLVDVRHFPNSRHNPQFNKEVLEKKLQKEGIKYYWLEKLGGFREGGYLSYTQTKNFEEGLNELIEIAKGKLTAIMCAEILWFKCHRKYIADKLKERGIEVLHIFNKEKIQEHFLKESKVKCDKLRKIC